MNFANFLLQVDKTMYPSLNVAGFKQTFAGKWNRHRGEELNTVWFQKHSSEPSFCINMGVHYSFLPKAGTETPLKDDIIEIPDCEIKFRLTEHPQTKDQWWPISEESIIIVSSLLNATGLALFDLYQIGGRIESIEIKDIENGDLGILKGMTNIRACLLLARLHEYLGNQSKCIDFANVGIKIAGLAVGPKTILKQILSRNIH